MILSFCCFCVGYSLALYSEVFLEQPQNATVNEADNATFRCAVVNSTFSILWRVNNSDAGYTRFREKGVVIIPDTNDYTRSELKVAGRPYNNNTLVQCGALRNYIDPVLPNWIKSDKALLIVQARQENSRIQKERIQSTCSLGLSHTEVVRRSVGLTKFFVPLTTPFLPPIPKEEKPKTSETQIVLFGITGVIMLCAALTAMSIFITLIFKKLTKAETSNHRNTTDADGKQIKLEPNPLYEYTKPIELQRNRLYEASKPIHTQASEHINQFNYVYEYV